MKNKGANNIKGVNYQQWAAMALFLQYLSFSDFEAINLEAPNSQDFDLLFKNKKIIGEAKGWQSNFSSTHLFRLLKNIHSNIALIDNDEILIVGSNISNNLIKNIENYKYFKNLKHHFKTKFKNNNEAELELLPRVKFWKINKKSLENLVYALFSEIISFWLPQDDLKEKLKDILIDNFYEGSSVGKTYTKSEFLSEIQSISKKAVSKTTLFNNEFRSLDRQFSNLIQDIKGQKKPQWGKYDMSSLSAQPNKMYFVLDQIKTEKFDLQEWELLWNVISIMPYYHILFNIFENNLNREKNKKYVFKFIKDNANEIKKFYQHDFFDIDVVKITKKILEKDKDSKFIKNAFDIVERLFIQRRNDIFYLKTQQDDSWERGEVAKYLKEIYQRANISLQDKIYRFIVSVFNLVEDDGNFSNYTPKEIFEIILEWLNKDLEKRLTVLTNVLSDQYSQPYKKFGKKLSFKGWEHMGGITSFWGNNYSVTDRHFIRYTLSPALEKYYGNSKNKKKAWKFIEDNCITKTKKVNAKRPDFLNRAVIKIILERYRNKDKKVSKEAKDILSEFILSRKGIPHKSELIYQSLLRGEFTSEKKWELVEVCVDRYKTPINPFVEQIVGDLAAKKHPQALITLSKWAKDPEYFRRTKFLGNSYLRNISQLVKTDFSKGFELFTDFTQSDYFIGSPKGTLDRFDAYEWARFLNEIMSNGHFKEGVGVLRNLAKKDSLSINEQILLTSSLCPLEESKDDSKLLDKIYTEFLDSFLDDFNNNNENIGKKLTYSGAREAIVQYADRLVRHQTIEDRIKKTLRIIEVFKNDPDPYLPGKDPEDLENKYNLHQKIEQGEDQSTISTVRGWCAWVLAKSVVLDGQKYIPKLIDWTKGLTEDPNLYVKHMSCFPLAQLARVRLSIMPDDKNKLFFGQNKKEALSNAMKMEEIAFKLLKEISSSSENIKKALGKSILHAFDYIRSLNEKRALEFITTIKTFPDEVIAEASALFIYYAEFRKEAYKNWKWKGRGKYDDLEPEKFNDKIFKNILEDLLKNASSTITSKFGWQFNHLVGEIPSDSKEVPNYFRISHHYLNILSKKYDHETFVDIYMFIQKYIKDNFEDCFELWRQCLKIEKPALEKYIKDGKINEVFWWPFHYNGEILSVVYKKAGEDDFIEWFKFLSDYPEGVNLGELKPAVEILKSFPKKNKLVGEIFEKLLKNDTKYYNDREEWKNK